MGVLYALDVVVILLVEMYKCPALILDVWRLSEDAFARQKILFGGQLMHQQLQHYWDFDRTEILS